MIQGVFKEEAAADPGHKGWAKFSQIKLKEKNIPETGYTKCTQMHKKCRG